MFDILIFIFIKIFFSQFKSKKLLKKNLFLLLLTSKTFKFKFKDYMNTTHRNQTVLQAKRDGSEPQQGDDLDPRRTVEDFQEGLQLRLVLIPPPDQVEQAV